MGDRNQPGMSGNNLKLLACASVLYADSKALKQRDDQNYFKSAEWSPDGTCIISNSADNHIRTFIMYARPILLPSHR